MRTEGDRPVAGVWASGENSGLIFLEKGNLPWGQMKGGRATSFVSLLFYYLGEVPDGGTILRLGVSNLSLKSSILRGGRVVGLILGNFKSSGEPVKAADATATQSVLNFMRAVLCKKYRAAIRLQCDYQSKKVSTKGIHQAATKKVSIFLSINPYFSVT